MNNTNYDTIIIGGGASGCFAGITSARLGRKVLIIEKNDRLGKKLLITGKGRCNVTNNCNQEDFLANIPCNSRFMYSSSSMLSTYDVMNFFEEIGVPLKTERGNRVFPISDKSTDIVNSLSHELKKLGVEILKASVSELIISDGICEGVVASGKRYLSQTVLIATGGASYPTTGSDGSGYNLARQAGHTIAPIKPSLVPMVSTEDYCKKMMGLSLKNVTLSLIDTQNNKVIYKELGEMLFTHFGVSGPLVLSASSHIRKFEKERYRLSIDLKPALDEKQLDARIQRDFALALNKNFGNSLNKLFPTKLIPVIIRLSGIDPETKVNQITRAERLKLIALTKAFPITVKEFRPIEEAIITSGGVSVKEISPKTMESKLVSRLFFAGEIIDVDAYTGGFNLQIAFSTAYSAAQNL